MTKFRQIGIIGSGRVARALALGFAPHSEKGVRLWARSHGKAVTAAEDAGAVAVSEMIEVARGCDLVAIAVADDALTTVIADLAKTMPVAATAFVFHVSGGSGASVLDPLRSTEVLTAAIHPAMTFTGDPVGEVRRMADARFAVTGSSPEATGQARHIVGLLRGIAVDVSEERRPLYHAALCHASNHLVTLMAGASHALARAGIDEPAALLAPLVRAALENSLERGFAALSGPILRGDDQTVYAHLDALQTWDADLLPAYRAMALATLDELGRKDPSELRRKLD